jgi:SP family arabinose:H+ symporter-like MFS transporter
MLADLISIFAGFITIIPETFTFALGRFLSGISIGKFSVLCPLYVNEIAPAKISGRLGSLIQPFCCFGLITAYAFALMLPTSEYSEDPKNNLWMFMFAFQALVGFMQLVLFLLVFKFETVPWLLEKNKKNEAKETFQFFFPVQEIEMFEDLEKSEKNQENPDFSYCDLIKCAKGTRKSMRLGLFLSLVQQFSGINAILSYATSLFGSFGSGVFISRVFTLANGFVNFSATFCLMRLIDGVGRKKTLIGGTIIMGLCLGVMSAFSAFQVFYVFPFLVIQVYVLCFGLSIGPICWIYSGEVLSSRGMSICSAVNWFSAFLVILFFPFMVGALGLSWTFAIFAGVNVVGAGYFAFDMVETKGMNKSDIQKMFINL